MCASVHSHRHTVFLHFCNSHWTIPYKTTYTFASWRSIFCTLVWYLNACVCVLGRMNHFFSLSDLVANCWDYKVFQLGSKRGLCATHEHVWPTEKKLSFVTQQGLFLYAIWDSHWMERLFIYYWTIYTSYKQLYGPYSSTGIQKVHMNCVRG